MTERIDHAKDALDRVIKLETAFAPIKDRNIDIRVVANLNANAMRELSVAQVHATLALVEQQRIANLIAAFEMEGGPYKAANDWIVDEYGDGEEDANSRILREIREGLGLS